MRHIIKSAIFIAGVVALLSIRAITADTVQGSPVAGPAASLSVMQIMERAKELPVEQFDAF
jgi:hypothetical protein